jgi:Lrp/AsnC family leucine-responsive transcriptional regulator
MRCQARSHSRQHAAPLTIRVLVSLEREGTAALNAFEQKVRERQEVQGAWYVTGEVDFVLQLQVSSLEAYERFTREVFHDDPNVRAFRTIITLRDVVIGSQTQRENALRCRPAQ